jgi:ribonucleoside-diphosphate reductase alpha chain
VVEALPTGVRKRRPPDYQALFVPPGRRAQDLVIWVRRQAIEWRSEAPDVEIPESWSPLAAEMVARLYLRRREDGRLESSVKEMVDRVVHRLVEAALDGGYFSTQTDARAWGEDLRWLVFTQHASFNSPVWFNFGVPGQPQQAAGCFINKVEDSMESILELARVEGMLFKFGSGAGVNLSVLRSSHESLSSGGFASGPIPFMRALDALAGAVKAAGAVRRAASMIVLDVSHPDILEFIRCKAEEERKASALVDAGYAPEIAYATVHFQNANHSVRAGDEFMSAVESDSEWSTRAVIDGNIVDTYRARGLWSEIANAAWTCGDPGMQFDAAIQSWNTVPIAGRINATNACSELAFLDETACNLLSLNLLKFLDSQGVFEIERFRQAIQVCLLAQEVLVSASTYPTTSIAENSERLRPLGLGFTNLGALLMAMGLPYASERARLVAATIAALMTGEAYLESSRLARLKGPFAEFAANKEPMLAVIARHRAAAMKLTIEAPYEGLARAAGQAWDEALAAGRRHGYRNAQTTAIAPGGTTGMMMDCDTTGIEPDLAFVKTRRIRGGDVLRLVNRTMPVALFRLGYDAVQIESILSHVETNGTMVGAPGFRAADLPVFDCALGPTSRRVDPLAQVRMVAAVQPFISGSISKTVNLASETTPDEVGDVFLAAWRLGLKSIAIYRDGSKRLQPVEPGSSSP